MGALAVIGITALVVVVTRCGGTTYTAVTVPVSKNPVGVALDAGARTVYVTNSGDNTVSVIDGSKYTVLGNLPVGNKPEGVATDPGTHTAYVTNSDDNTVSVIDGPKHAVTDTMAEKIRDIRHVEFGGMAPSGLAVDPGSHAIYVANRGDNSVWVFERR